MSMPSVIALCVVITLAGASRAPASVLVAFRDKASVKSSLVTLGDVAELHAADAADAQRLSAVILGPAPAAGREGVISYETVRSRLLSAGVDLAEIQFSGPATIGVTGPDSASTAGTEGADGAGATGGVSSRIEAAIVQAIRRYLATQSRGGTFDVSVTVSEDAARLLASAPTRGVEVSGGQPPWLGEQVFVLRVLDAEERVREVQLRCQVAARPSVLAARQALPRGHVIGPDDLVWKKSQNDAESGGVTDPRELIGCETQQALRAGQPIPRDAVKTLPLVRNGQFVTVSSRRPGLAVQRVMKSKGEGGLGSVIALQTLEDHKTVLGRVTGLLEADIVDSSDKPPAAMPIASSDSPSSPTTTAIGNPDSLIAMPTHDGGERESLVSDMPRVFVNPVRPMSVPVSMIDPVR